MDGRHEDPGTRLSWKGLVPIGLAAVMALLIGGGVDVAQSHDGVAGGHSRFVVGVTESGTALVVRDAETGDDVGLPVAAPQGRRFQRVAAVEKRSYIVASYADRKVTFQRLHLRENGEPKELEDIPKATVPGESTEWSELAVGPDGDRIAYVTYEGARSRVDVVSAASGNHKVWTTKLSGRVGSLSWSGATLSFVWSPVRSVGGELRETEHEVRTLDTSGAAGDLRMSKAVLTLPQGSTTAVLSGETIIAGIVKNSQLSLQAYTLDGEPTEVLWQRKVKGELTDLDAAPEGKGIVATAGDIYTRDGQPVPGEDLADAAW